MTSTAERVLSPSAAQRKIAEKRQQNAKLEALWNEVPRTINRPTNSGRTITYELGKYLGKGGYAKVYELTEQTTGNVYAVKVIAKASLVPKAKARLHAEIKIHRGLSHEGIIQYEAVMEDTKFVYILLELCTNKTLMNLVKTRKTVSEDEARYFFVQLCESLQYLKSEMVIHRDLKLGNIMLDSNMRVKIADFGLATKLSKANERKKTICGTPNYMAPEILRGGVTGHSYEVDIWSLGVILYTLLVGKPPFETSDISITYQKIMQNEYSFPEGSSLSLEAEDLIRKLLHPEAQLRPSIEQILEHDFFQNKIIPSSLPLYALNIQPTRRAQATASNFWDTELDMLNLANGNNKLPLAPTTVNSQTGSSKTLPKKFTKPLPSSRNDENSANRQIELPPSNRIEKPLPKPIVIPSSPMKIQETTIPIRSIEGPTMDISYEDQLAALHSTMSNALEIRNQTSSNSNSNSSNFSEQLHIVRWVDDTKRFGFGFQLSNGCTSVYFNDDSKMLFDPRSNYLWHFAPVIQESTGQVNLNRDEITLVHFSRIPSNLVKKSKILIQFRYYFLFNKNADYVDKMCAEMRAVIPDVEEPSSCVFVQRFLHSRHSLCFKLSNGTLQNNFFDHAKIMVHLQANQITFVNTKAERKFYSLDSSYLDDRYLRARFKEMIEDVNTFSRIAYHYLPDSKLRVTGKRDNSDLLRSPQPKRAKVELL